MYLKLYFIFQNLKSIIKFSKLNNCNIESCNKKKRKKFTEIIVSFIVIKNFV